MKTYYIVAESGHDYYTLESDKPWVEIKRSLNLLAPGWRALFTESMFDPSIFQMCLGRLA